MRGFLGMTVAVLMTLAVPAALVHAADIGKPATITPDQLTWVPSAHAPGVMTAVAWGDPDRGPHGAFHKFVPGFTAPLHTHSSNGRAVVLAGTLSLTGEDGKEVKLPPGSFFAQPSTYKHVTKCLDGAECLVYLDADGRWDVKPVEGKK